MLKMHIHLVSALNWQKNVYIQHAEHSVGQLLKAHDAVTNVVIKNIERCNSFNRRTKTAQTSKATITETSQVKAKCHWQSAFNFEQFL